jgi:hypothetical protein
LGIISLLSPAYLLSVERWPFHTGPPDHYDRLSSLLDLPFRIFSTDNEGYWVSHKEQLIEWFADAVEDGSIHFHTGERRK